MERGAKFDVRRSKFKVESSRKAPRPKPQRDDMSCWRVSAGGATPTNVMTEQKSNTSEVRAEQVANKKYQTLKLGLDVHADTIVVVRILEHGAPQPAQKFIPAKFLEWVKTQLTLADAV